MLLSLTALPSSSGTTVIYNSIVSSGTIVQEARHTNSNPDLLLESYSSNIRRVMFSGFESADTYAAKSDVWIGHIEQVSTALLIHETNQNHTCLLYRNIRLLWLPGTTEYNEDQYNLFIANGWLLKGASGEYVNVKNQAYLVDFGNPAYQTWVANWYKSNLDSYGLDGVYIDNCLPNDEIFYSLSEWPINPRTGESWHSNQVTEALTNLVNTIKDAIGPKIVIGNIVISGTHFFREDLHQSYVEFLTNSKLDGFLCEMWVSSFSTPEWYTEEKWKEGIDMAVWVDKNYLSNNNKIFWTMSDNAETLWPPGQIILPSGVTQEQYATYCYASRLLTITNGQNWINFGLYMPEDFPQCLFQIDIGTPIGEYYTMSSHIYVREYTDGKILVNPTYTSFTITIGEGYADATTGASLSSTITVQPHTGLILSK